MKQRISSLLLIILFILSGCQKQQPSYSSVVTTSFYPIYLITQAVVDGASDITIQNLAQPQTGCLHDYQLSTRDMKILENTDTFIINGLGMESFIDHAIRLYPDLSIINSSIHGEDLRLIENEEHDHHHTNGEAEELDHFNSHIWLSPQNAAVQAETICEELIKRYPQNAMLFRQNTDHLVSSLTSDQTLSVSSYKPIKAISLHEGFVYLADFFSINIAHTLSLDENRQPSARELGSIIDLMKKEKIELLLTADDSGRKLAEVLSRETGAKIILLNPITSPIHDTETFTEVMKQNLFLLKEVLDENS